MKFKEFGSRSNPAILLLHGGGLSYWSLNGIIEGLKEKYNIITPIIDGHGEDGDTIFLSIEDSADKLITYIDANYDGHIYAIGGLSIGAQIVCEVLSKRADIATHAIIESALVFPIKGTTLLTVPTYKLFYGLILKRWFSKLQAKTLFVPEEMFEQYFADSQRISKDSLINITLSNGNYSLKEDLSKVQAKTLIIVGQKELGIMNRSAQALNRIIPNSTLYVAEKMGHGELSLRNQTSFIEKLYQLFRS